MSNRAFDIGLSGAFDLGFPARTSAAPFGFITGVYSRVKSLGLVTFKPTVAGGGGADTFQHILQEADAPGLYHQNTYDNVDDGSIKLKEGAALQTEIAIPFTQSAVDYRTPIGVVLWVSKLGIPALAAGGKPSISVSIETDAAGDPSGTSVSDSYNLATEDISGLLTGVLIGFQGGPAAVANGGSYWVVIKPNYDASATDCIQVHYNTVVGTSACKVNSGGWAAIANQDVWFQLHQVTFTDVDVSKLGDGGAFDPYDESVIFANTIDSAQIRTLDTRRVKEYLRFRYDISGGNWYPWVFAMGAYPYQLPLIGEELDVPLL